MLRVDNPPLLLPLPPVKPITMVGAGAGAGAGAGETAVQSFQISVVVEDKEDEEDVVEDEEDVVDDEDGKFFENPAQN